MSAEAIARLSYLQELIQEKNSEIFSSKIIKDNEEILRKEIEIMKYDLKFLIENAGPYSFPFFDKQIHIFTPEHTQNGDWVMILYDEKTQTKEQLQIFHSIIGMISGIMNITNNLKQNTNE